MNAVYLTREKPSFGNTDLPGTLCRVLRQFGMSESTSSSKAGSGVSVGSLKWLLGCWVGKGKGKYATIDAFTY